VETIPHLVINMQAWNVIYLVNYNKTNNTDEYGDVVYSEVRTKVYAECKSIGQKEFYQAQTAGMNPEIKFVLASSRDYNEQKEIIFNNVRYKVLKTYIPSNDSIEITCYGGVREDECSEISSENE